MTTTKIKTTAKSATILCEAKVLLRELGAVRSAAQTSSALRALSGVRITSDKTGVRVRCADLDVSFERTLPIQAREGEFDVLLPVKQLMDAVKLFERDGLVGISPSETGTEMKLAWGSRTITLGTLQLDDFPPRPSPHGTKLLTANGGELAEVIERASVFASRNETRPVLCTLHFERDLERFEVVATDSYRLCILRVPGDMGPATASVNVGERGLRLAAKAMRKEATVNVVLGSGHTILRWPGTTITVRNVEGQYPDYAKLIPEKFPSQITMSVSELRSACDVAVKMLTGNSPVRLSANKQVKLHGVNHDVGSFEDILVGAKPEIKGGEIEIGFNPVFLRHITSVLKDNSCVLRLITPLRPALIEQGDDKFLLMPIRLNV